MKKVLFFAAVVVATGLASCGSDCLECKNCNDATNNGKSCRGDNGTTDQDFADAQVFVKSLDGVDGCSCTGF